ncbi:MAG: GSCFA family protein [Ancylobacter novellus]|uniref:GSCFA family protein n=1 Tax=Ancylobacter novellus TaxID=921 RepID=A0A2W5K5H6_ANCNO|nr:MAG: GSCFA family protein [Ancylobacter novellus]
MAKSPYSGLPSNCFWSSGVADEHPLTIADLYAKRFAIDRKTRIAAAGSCFAQHISRNLRDRGCAVLDVEPAPSGLSQRERDRRGYGVYSARYANIYTAAQLLQLIKEAFGKQAPTDRVWEKNGRYYDAQRPGVEPEGFATEDEVLAHREHHLLKVRRLLRNTDLLVFTFGLTEAWTTADGATVFPTCPGTLAGSFDAGRYVFKNYLHDEVLKDFIGVRTILKAINPQMKFLITVSPVPLVATASDIHVLQATTYSKSVLRAVCGALYQQYADVDYFPSYELIASPFSRSFFFKKDLREVSEAGVDAAMRMFFRQHANLDGSDGAAVPEASGHRRLSAAKKMGLDKRGGGGSKKVVCEEEMLMAFNK